MREPHRVGVSQSQRPRLHPDDSDLQVFVDLECGIGHRVLQDSVGPVSARKIGTFVASL
jgi:hypothetical protein